MVFGCARVIFSRARPPRRRARRIFRDEPEPLSGLADGENSVSLIETTQLLLGSDRSIQLWFTRRRQNSKQFRPPPLPPCPEIRDTGRSKLQGTQPRMVRTYLPGRHINPRICWSRLFAVLTRRILLFPMLWEPTPVLLQAPRSPIGRSAVDIAKRVSSERDQTFRCTVFHYMYTAAPLYGVA